MTAGVSAKVVTIGFEWDALEQWNTYCQWNSRVDQLQMNVAEALRGESFQRRQAALQAALEAGSVESVAYLLRKEIVRVDELSEEQQLECWKGVRSAQMRELLEREGFKISSPEQLLRHLLSRTTTDVVESFIKAGVEEGLEAIYNDIKGVDTYTAPLIRSYVVAIRFCKGEVSLESIDAKAFEVIRSRGNLNAFGEKQLAALWVLTCKFNYFDEMPGSFFARLVHLFFSKEQRAEVKFTAFLVALDCITVIPRYLLEKGKIVAEELTPEQQSQCWTHYVKLATAPVLKQHRFNVNAETVVNDKPMYPINIVVQMDVEEDLRLCRVTDLLESGATSGVQEALEYCRDHELPTIVKLIEQHLGGQRFLQEFDGLMATNSSQVCQVLSAVKRELESGTIGQIVLNTRRNLGPNFYADDLMFLKSILEKMGLHITVTHLYIGHSTFTYSRFKGELPDNAGCKFKVSFKVDG